jgi:hypothetical protein
VEAKLARRVPLSGSILRYTRQGYRYGQLLVRPQGPATSEDRDGNPVHRYFESHVDGQGIWKWRHYFEIYHRHLARSRGKEVHIVEMGIYSGGSLMMWRDYLGPSSRVYGVDIEPACRVYEADRIRVFVGDQARGVFGLDFARLWQRWTL